MYQILRSTLNNKMKILREFKKLKLRNKQMNLTGYQTQSKKKKNVNEV